MLLRSIADLDPHSGTVTLDKINAGLMKPADWRRQVGLLPAESRWWHDTVGEHFIRLEAALLQTLGFEEDVFGWQIKRLSTGEKQRLSIARLLALSPRALLLDEPTANLDANNVEKLETLLTDYLQAHKTPGVWITHDPGQVRRIADRHFVLTKEALTEQEPGK